MLDFAGAVRLAAGRFFEWPSERVIALARIILAVFAPLAVYLEQPPPPLPTTLLELLGVTRNPPLNTPPTSRRPRC